MENDRALHSKWLVAAVCFYEMIGSAGLVCAINMTSETEMQIPAACLMTMVCGYILGPFSGCHLNPAITVGHLIGFFGCYDFK